MAAVVPNAEIAQILTGLMFLHGRSGGVAPSITTKAVIALLVCHSEFDLTGSLTERDMCTVLDVSEKTLRKCLKEAQSLGLLTINKNNRFGQKRYDLRPLADILRSRLTGRIATPHKPCVYLLFDPVRQLLKIGYTQDLRRRMNQVTNASGSGRIEILATITADRDVERGLIEEFRNYRIAGEWFHYRSEILDRFLEIRTLLGTEDSAANATGERRV